MHQKMQANVFQPVQQFLFTQAHSVEKENHAHTPVGDVAYADGFARAPDIGVEPREEYRGGKRNYERLNAYFFQEIHIRIE